MIRIGIIGYGNLGRGVECQIKNNPDMELVAIFTRRNPCDIKTLTNAKVLHVKESEAMINDIDVMILCGGSAKDLREQTPYYSKLFNTVDSFDTHANIKQHFNSVDKQALENKKTAIISVGWDPGMFSINRLYAESITPNGNTYTFWGKGVSQGHSDAIRRIDGVKDAKQYTIPVLESLEKVRNGLNPNLSTREKHTRECFVVVNNDSDKKRIEEEIKNMPNYFSDYETIVHFIDEDEMLKNHSSMPHGGFVIRTAKTGIDNENNQIIEYNLKLDSNPEFTASILLAYARACYKLNKEQNYGAKTVFDIAPSYLSEKTKEKIIEELL